MNKTILSVAVLALVGNVSAIKLVGDDKPKIPEN